MSASTGSGWGWWRASSRAKRASAGMISCFPMPWALLTVSRGTLEPPPLFSFLYISSYSPPLFFTVQKTTPKKATVTYLIIQLSFFIFYGFLIFAGFSCHSPLFLLDSPDDCYCVSTCIQWQNTGICKYLVFPDYWTRWFYKWQMTLLLKILVYYIYNKSDQTVNLSKHF